MLLQEELQNCRGEYERFVMFLAERAGLPAHSAVAAQEADEWQDPAKAGGAIELQLGNPGIDVSTKQPVHWLLNGPGSPHVAIMGGTGSGKTRLAMNLIRQVRKKAPVPVILFDMAKGDLAADQELVQALQATVIACPGRPIPLDVLHVADRTPSEILDAAMRFRESFVLVAKTKPGGVQLDALRDAAQRSLQGGQRVTLRTIRDALKNVYAETNRKPDAVSALFNDLTGWTLFEPQFTPREFFARSWIIDLHGATETAQRLVVFLMLDAIYAYLKALPEAALDGQNRRSLRLVVGIDEARRVLGYRQPSLSQMIREQRSKGLSVFLMSQSPEDYDSEDDNFLENVGLSLCFKTNATSSRALRALFGQTLDLASLATGVAVTRLPGQREVTRVQAWM